MNVSWKVLGFIALLIFIGMLLTGACDDMALRGGMYG